VTAWRRRSGSEAGGLDTAEDRASEGEVVATFERCCEGFSDTGDLGLDRHERAKFASAGAGHRRPACLDDTGDQPGVERGEHRSVRARQDMASRATRRLPPNRAVNDTVCVTHLEGWERQVAAAPRSSEDDARAGDAPLRYSSEVVRQLVAEGHRCIVRNRPSTGPRVGA